jgi:hypothetical protein
MAHPAISRLLSEFVANHAANPPRPYNREATAEFCRFFRKFLAGLGKPKAKR